MPRLEAPSPPLRTVAAGSFIGGNGPVSAVAFVTGNGMRGVPFLLESTTTFDRIAVSVTTAAATAQVRLGVMSMVNAIPTAILFDAGFIDASTTGIKTITISQTLTPGFYLPVAACFTAGCSMRAVASGSQWPLLADGAAFADVAGWSAGALDGAGALTAPSGASVVANCPLVLLRAA